MTPVCSHYFPEAKRGAEAALASDSLLRALQQRYVEVALRLDGEYELGRRILLSAAEVQVLLDGDATIEELVMFRNRPSHLMPARLRNALYRVNTLRSE